MASERSELVQRRAELTHRSPNTMRSRPGQVASPDRHKSGLHRYCSACAQETEHVAQAADGQGAFPRSGGRLLNR